jgi:hypothetical protein
MCLGDVVGSEYYTDESEAARIVEELNNEYGGDFGYKKLTGK